MVLTHICPHGIPIRLVQPWITSNNAILYNVRVWAPLLNGGVASPNTGVTVGVAATNEQYVLQWI